MRGRVRRSGVPALPLLISVSVVAQVGALPRSTDSRRAEVPATSADRLEFAASGPRAAGAARLARVAVAGAYRSAGVLPLAGGGWRLEDPARAGGATVRVAGLPARDVVVRFDRPVSPSWSRELRIGGAWVAAGHEAVRLPGAAVDVRLRAEAGAAPLVPQVLEVRWQRAVTAAADAGATGYVKVEAPEVIGREAWGAHAPFEAYDLHRPEAIVVHHSWLPTQADYARTGGAESVAGIQRFHMFDPTRGWNDVGYHYLIGPDGLVFAGRPPEAVGAHAVPNTGKVGICMIGNHDPDGAPVTAEAWRALQQLVTTLADRYDIPMRELYGHRNFSYKTCPGDLVYERFPELREEVVRRIGTMGFIE